MTRYVVARIPVAVRALALTAFAVGCASDSSAPNAEPDAGADSAKTDASSSVQPVNALADRTTTESPKGSAEKPETTEDVVVADLNTASPAVVDETSDDEGRVDVAVPVTEDKLADNATKTNDGQVEETVADVVPQDAEPNSEEPTILDQLREITPPPKLDLNVAADGATYAQHVRNAVSYGLAGDIKKHREPAEESLASARKICATDPRLDFIEALMQWRRQNRDDAFAKIDEAKSSGGYPYLRAAMVEIIWLATVRQTDAALEQSAAMADLLTTSTASWPGNGERQAAAFFLGRFTGFLQRPSAPARTRQAIDAGVAKVQEALDEKFDQAFELGRADFLDAYNQLIADRRADSDRAAAEREEEKAEELAALKEDKEKLSADADTLEMNEKEWKNWLNEQTARLDDQISSIEREHSRTFDDLDQSHRRIRLLLLQSESIRQSSSNIRLDSSDSDGNRRSQTLDPRISGGFSGSSLVYLQLELREEQEKARMLETQILRLRQQADRVFAERRGVVNRFEQATGQRVRHSAKLQAAQKALARKAKRIERKKPKRSRLPNPNLLKTHFPNAYLEEAAQVVLEVQALAHPQPGETAPAAE